MNSSTTIAYIEMARRRIREKKYKDADSILQGIEMCLLGDFPQ